MKNIPKLMYLRHHVSPVQKKLNYTIPTIYRFVAGVRFVLQEKVNVFLILKELTRTRTPIWWP